MRLRRGVVGMVLIALVAASLGADAYTEQQSSPTHGIRGVAFAPFRDCQSPELKKFPTLADMRHDVDLIKGMGNALRTYSSRNGMAEAAEYAQASGLRVSAGAWLGPEKTTEGKEANRLEIESLISLANRTPLESVIVGNEVLLRGDLTADQLAAYIREVKARLPGVRVTTAEIASIAVDPKNRAVIDEIDYLMANIYPYWDGVDIDAAAWYVAEIFRTTERAANKKVVIGETGWPSAGPPHGKAIPNVDNAERFLAEWIAVARDENIDYYYFAANDEGWKQEGGVGAYWGILDSARHPKHRVTTLLTDPGPAPPKPAQGRPSSYEQDAPAADSAVKPDAFSIYDDWTAATGTYVPSGYMGDVNDITLDDCHRDPQAGKTAVRVAYLPSASAKNGWAGVAWLLPGTNWGTAPGGKDLTGYTTLTFYARGERGGEKLTFFTGGVTGPHGDTAKKEEITVVLTGQWQRYAISLAGADLRRVVAAFGWAASRVDNPNGATFHLDSIQFDRSPPPRRPCVETPAGTRYLLDGTALCATASPVQKYDFGVDSSEKHRTWLATEPDSLRMTYPPGQKWGAVSLTVGNPAPPGQRTGQDISSCHTLQVDLRATIGGSMRVGMKDTTMPDDGSEKKVKVTPTGQWDTYSFGLNTFTGVNLTKVYVLAEFVFEGPVAQTVYFRNLRFLC